MALEKVIYQNHQTEKLKFGSAGSGLYVNESDLHDYAWDNISRNNKISGFEMGIVEKKLPVIVVGETEKERQDILNNLFEIAERDVLAVSHGKLIVGDYYCKCFITGSSKSNYLKLGQSVANVDLKIQTDYPQWMKETQYNFSSGQTSADEWLDYNVDFDYDYMSTLTNQRVNNTGFVASNFRLIIYGAVENPAVYINGHLYQVNVQLEASEYLVIDSIDKTIKVTRYDGTEENAFGYREKSSYIFERIATGSNIVTWSGDFNFDVILIEERSEPKWTT